MRINRQSAFITMLVLLMDISSHAKTVFFSGYEWEVRPSEERGSPGPNFWDERNVFVDAGGALHLKITRRDGQWYCAEVYTTALFKFGTYQFWIDGRVDRLDPNVVLGLFNYPESDIGPDGTNEMDIEFARWGNPLANPGNYTVYPTRINAGQESKNFPMHLRENGLTTQRFVRGPTAVLFQSLNGHCSDNSNLFHSWLYAPADPEHHISQSAMRVHMNLWCFEGRGPGNARPVEVVIRAFHFTGR